MFAFVTRFLATGTLFLSGWFSSGALAQSTPVSIPANLQGLYRLDMVDAQLLSPIKATNTASASDDIQVVITALGTLCVGEGYPCWYTSWLGDIVSNLDPLSSTS